MSSPRTGCPLYKRVLMWTRAQWLPMPSFVGPENWKRLAGTRADSGPTVNTGQTHGLGHEPLSAPPETSHPIRGDRLPTTLVAIFPSPVGPPPSSSLPRGRSAGTGGAISSTVLSRLVRAGDTFSQRYATPYSMMGVGFSRRYTSPSLAARIARRSVIRAQALPDCASAAAIWSGGSSRMMFGGSPEPSVTHLIVAATSGTFTPADVAIIGSPLRDLTDTNSHSARWLVGAMTTTIS